MPRFAVMAKANRIQGGPGRVTNHLHVQLFMHDAASVDEANGFGLRFARTVWPQGNGFTAHEACSITDATGLKPESEWTVVE